MNEAAEEALQTLMAGNERYRNSESNHHRYEHEHRQAMVQGQKPIAAIVCCVDSRVAPEAIFDQPMGTMFVSRVPGNVASDGVKWMVDLAVGEFEVPLLMVIGHSGCMAIKGVLSGESKAGGLLRFKIQAAASKAGARQPTELYSETIRANAQHTVQELVQESSVLRDSIAKGKTCAVAAVFDIGTGRVELLDR